MNNEDNNNNKIDPSTEKDNNILSDEFFSEINNLKKLNERKAKIDYITNYLKENKLQNIENNISKLYDFLLSNLNENNNNYVLSQLKLIETLINNNKNENFQNFAKKALPKLFDKYYLQNQKINENITNILNKFIHNKILNLQDYYPHIENISLDEEDNYRNNILNLLWENIEKNEDIDETKMPKGILDIFSKLCEDKDDNISDAAKKTVKILQQRKNENLENNNNNQNNINEENNKNDKEGNNDEKKNGEIKENVTVPNDIEKKENSEDENLKTQINNPDNEETLKPNITKIIKNIEEQNNINQNNNNLNINSQENKKETDIKPNKNEINDDFDTKKALEQIEKLINSQELKKSKIETENQNKATDKTENKETKVEEKETNDININNDDKESMKEGGVKRSVIQGKLNKFRKQFGKGKKTKDITKSQIVSNENNENEINNNINNKEDNSKNEIKRTNTIEEMFKKKLEDGFDTETNNILDLGKGNNNNYLDEIEDKLGINFNEIINEGNKKSKEENNSNNNKSELITTKIDNPKKIENPDDRPIHPSKNLKLDFDLDFEQNEKIVNKNDNNNSKEKKSPKNFKKIIINKDLEELGKMTFNNKSQSSNINSNKIEEISDIKNNEDNIKSFNIEENNKEENEKNQDKENIKNTNNKKEININITKTLNDINQTLDNLNNLNIIKKTISDERRPKLKIDDFQKKLELALEQEQNEVDKEIQEDEKKEEDEKSNKNKYKEDPRFDNIKSILGNKIIENLFSNKWEQKKEAYELINNYIETNDLDTNNSNDLFEYLRFKLKNFKETNFNVNREAINVFITLTKKKLINKENLLSVILGYNDKITDPKLKDNFIDLLNSCLDIIEPNLLLKQLLMQIPKKNNAKLFIEYSLYLGKIVEKYNATKDLPYKELTEFSKIMANNSNPQCRNAGTNLICILYRYYGEEVRKLIKDIKESTLKNIENEISKITVIERRNSINTKQKSSNKRRPSEIIDSKNNVNGGDKGLNGGAKNEIKQNIISDISKKITPQLLKNISDGKWAEKKEACEQIEKLLKEANMKILPNGLNELMNLIKKKLTDGNKNIVRMMINLLGQLIEALKHHFKQWSKNIAINLIPNLSDKNQIFRNEIQICLDKWVQFVGFDTLIIYFPPFLKQENVEIRNEIFIFINKYKNKFNKETGIPVFKDMEENLLLCLQDKTANIRTQAEEMIKFSLNYVKLNNYYEKIKKYKPAITNDLKIILDKIQTEIYGDTSDNTNTEINNNKSKTEKKKDEDDDDLEGNININEIINSNSKSNSNSNNKNGNGGSTHKINHRNSFSGKKEKETSDFLKSNSSIIGTAEHESSTHRNMKFKKVLKKQKTKESTFNKSIDLSKTFSKELKYKDKEKDKNTKMKDLSSKKNIILNYKTISNFNKRKNVDDKDSSMVKSAQKEIQIKSKVSTDNININNKSMSKEKKSNESSAKKLLGAFGKLKVLSNSLILNKKSDKKGQKKDEVFCPNIKVIPNKSKRLENDLKFKFSLDYIAKDSTFKAKVKEQSKNLFTDEFNKKIFSDDFKKQVNALQEMKEQIDKKVNSIIYFENLDIILKVLGIKLNGNINPTLVKNLFEFFDSLYIIITEKGNPLNEIEINIIISLLIDKLSINNNILKERLMKLLDEFIELSDINRNVLVILNNSLGKNNKIKTDILDFIIDLHSRKKLNLSSKNYVKILGKYICINDNIVKSKVLILLKEMYSELGEELFYILDFLTDKDKEFLVNNLIQENNDIESEEEVEIEKQPESPNSSDDEDYRPVNKKKKNNVNITNNNILNGSINSEKDLLNNLKKLLVKNESEQLNAIILIHEIVHQKYEENKKILIPNIDKVIEIFIQVLHELFIDNDIKNIPIKFTRYITTVLLKISSNQELISHLGYKILSEITNELLNYLLIQGFDKIKEQKEEGSIIFKSINSTMLRIIENCNKTNIILVLLDIIKKYQKGEGKKIGSLSVKCLLKATENLSKIIDNLDLKKILNEMHIIVYNYEQLYPDLKNKQQTDDVILRFIRNFINNLVELKQNSVLDIYNESIKKSDKEDKYIIYWIKNCLEKISKNDKTMSLNISNISNIDNFNSTNNSIDINNKKEKEIENIIKKIDIENKKEIVKEEGGNEGDNNNNNKDMNKIEELKKKWNEVKSK